MSVAYPPSTSRSVRAMAWSTWSRTSSRNARIVLAVTAPQYACLTRSATSVFLTSTPAWAARTPCSAAMRAFSMRPHVKIGWMMLTVPRTNTPVMSGEYWSSGEET